MLLVIHNEYAEEQHHFCAMAEPFSTGNIPLSGCITLTWTGKFLTTGNVHCPSLLMMGTRAMKISELFAFHRPNKLSNQITSPFFFSSKNKKSSLVNVGMNNSFFTVIFAAPV